MKNFACDRGLKQK